MLAYRNAGRNVGDASSCPVYVARDLTAVAGVLLVAERA